MPQASDELRNLMEKWFGHCVDDRGPRMFLLSHGFSETKTGLFFPPVPYHNVSREELACLRFLVDEWDCDYVISSYYPEHTDG